MEILYLLVHDQRIAHLHSAFRLIRESEMALLRCLMTLTQLPSDASTILPTDKPFSQAITRLSFLPRVRGAQSSLPLDSTLADMVARNPLVVLLVGRFLPSWLRDLAAQRPVGLLTDSGRTAGAALATPGVIPGLLQGDQALREAYRVLRELAGQLAQQERWPENVRRSLRSYSGVDLFQSRSRLSCIPALPLPPPSSGRPAAYLLARMGNCCDDLAIHPSPPSDSSRHLDAMLRAATQGALVLSAVEQQLPIPPGVSIPRDELLAIRAAVLAEGEREPRFATLCELGWKAAGSERSAATFVTAGIPRRDLIVGRVPPGAQADRRYRKWGSAANRALNDEIAGPTPPAVQLPTPTAPYDLARQTLVWEDRVLACHTPVLASRVGSFPIQIPLASGHVYSEVADLVRSIESGSRRKVSRLFNRVEMTLARLVPPDTLARIADGTSGVTFYSDLPFEWMAIPGTAGDWPVCLSKKVSRIPIGLAHWDVLSAALESRTAINSRTPGRVLVLDLLQARDPIRSETDAFISVSDDLGQRYTYASPESVGAFRRVVEESQAEVVVLDSHGSYDAATDTLLIGVGEVMAGLDDLLPRSLVPPVWILSACDTSVTGSVRGCFVRSLLARGARCVVATLARIDAFTASMFVGKLLTEIYNPVNRAGTRSLDDVFFFTQLWTALLYDPLLPLIRRSKHKRAMKEPLGAVFGEFSTWASGRGFTARELQVEAALVLDDSLRRHGLWGMHAALVEARQVTPETLLFTAFGAPGRIELVD